MYINNKHLSLFLIVIFVAILCGCVGLSDTDATSRLKIGESAEKIYAAELVDSVSLIFLKENDACIVGEIKKVEETNEHFFVMNQQCNMIAKFGKDGEYVDKLYRVGRSKSEYIRINDFSIDKKSDMLVLLCDYTKLIFCDLSFNIKDIRILDFPLERICVSETRIYGYSSMEDKVVLLSEDGPQDMIQGPKLPAWVFSQSEVFFKTDGTLLVALECDNHIYRIDNDGVSKVMSITYDGYDEVVDRYEDGNKGDNNGFFDLCLPVRIRNLNLKGDTLDMVYAKDIVVRGARINLRAGSLIHDGIFMGSPSPEWNGCHGCVLAGSFANGKGLPIDSSYINKVNTSLDSIECGSVVVKYNFP